MDDLTTNPIDRIGGRTKVHAIVDDFYRRVAADPIQRAIYPEDLEPGIRKLKLFLEQWLGGPSVYSDLYGHPRLKRRHFPFVIDELAAGRWLRYMREAMTTEGVDADLQAAIFKGLGPLAHHMINAHEDVPRERLGDVRMV
jgi:hemoglobin